jgi:hypothetical protein
MESHGCPAAHDVSQLSGAKVLRSGVGVQLIVFFAAISRILKKGIYGRDKHRFYPMKTKGYLQSSRWTSHEPQMQVIRFVNGRFHLYLGFLLDGWSFVCTLHGRAFFRIQMLHGRVFI